MNKGPLWHEAITHCKTSGNPWVMATVIGTDGSTPRDCGSKMIITKDQTFDTVGGGRLKFLIIQKSRELLKLGNNQQSVEHFPLAVRSQQCCGGIVNVLFESFAEQVIDVHVFGAGHVAKALVDILGQLNVRLFWIDNRKDQFPTLVPSNTCVKHYENTVDHVNNLRPHAHAIVLTHDHALDYQLVEALLHRKDCAYIGLIGSKTKSMRFKKRLQNASFSEAQTDSIICPIGLPGVKGKHPMEVAVSISAQLIQYLNQNKIHDRTNGLSWKKLNAELENQKIHS